MAEAIDIIDAKGEMNGQLKITMAGKEMGKIG
jgi:hypothetical protein